MALSHGLQRYSDDDKGHSMAELRRLPISGVLQIAKGFGTSVKYIPRLPRAEMGENFGGKGPEVRYQDFTPLIEPMVRYTLQERLRDRLLANGYGIAERRSLKVLSLQYPRSRDLDAEHISCTREQQRKYSSPVRSGIRHLTFEHLDRMNYSTLLVTFLPRLSLGITLLCMLRYTPPRREGLCLLA